MAGERAKQAWPFTWQGLAASDGAAQDRLEPVRVDDDCLVAIGEETGASPAVLLQGAGVMSMVVLQLATARLS